MKVDINFHSKYPQLTFNIAFKYTKLLLVEVIETSFE